MCLEGGSALKFVPGERVVLELRVAPGVDMPHPVSPMAGTVVDADGQRVRLQYGTIVTPVPLDQVTRVQRPHLAPPT